MYGLANGVEMGNEPIEITWEVQLFLLLLFIADFYEAFK
jgi:hypothetical protein